MRREHLPQTEELKHLEVEIYKIMVEPPTQDELSNYKHQPGPQTQQQMYLLRRSLLIKGPEAVLLYGIAQTLQQ